MTYDSEFAVFSRYANVTVRAIYELIFHGECRSLIILLSFNYLYVYLHLCYFLCVYAYSILIPVEFVFHIAEIHFLSLQQCRLLDGMKYDFVSFASY